MAGEYSRELSVKVQAGQARLIERGFRCISARPNHPHPRLNATLAVLYQPPRSDTVEQLVRLFNHLENRIQSLPERTAQIPVSVFPGC